MCVNELLALSLVNKEMNAIVNHHYGELFLYERIEHCLRKLISYVESKPPNVAVWFFHVYSPSDNTNRMLSVQKQTLKNKCKHKSMMVYQQLVC